MTEAVHTAYDFMSIFIKTSRVSSVAWSQVNPGRILVYKVEPMTHGLMANSGDKGTAANLRCHRLSQRRQLSFHRAPDRAV